MQNQDVMKLLAGLGGAITLIEAIIGFGARNIGNSRVILLILSIVLATIILLSIIVPHKFVELNWLICVLIGILMIVYSSLIENQLQK